MHKARFAQPCARAPANVSPFEPVFQLTQGGLNFVGTILKMAGNASMTAAGTSLLIRQTFSSLRSRMWLPATVAEPIASRMITPATIAVFVFDQAVTLNAPL